jgi:hypothetical protein
VTLSGIMSSSLPATSEVLIGLDDDTQTCLRIIALAFNSTGGNFRDVFWCFDTGRSGVWDDIFHLSITEESRQKIMASRFRLID